MYGESEISRVPRAALAVVHALVVAMAAWILFGAPAGARVMGVALVATPPARRAIVLAAAAIYYLRVLGTLVLLRRRMRYGEAVTIMAWLAFVHIWIALLARSVADPLGARDVVWMALYLAGSCLNTGSEWARWRWKRRPGNAGHLYTGGPFRLTRHPNYLGDTLLFAGYALLTGRPAALVVPLLMAVLFTTANIPMLDRHLAEHYGAEYARWAAGTKRFVPWIY